MPSRWEKEPNDQAAGAWVTIGSFDGVHLGHQTIIKQMVAESRKAFQPAIVITFFPHPVKVLRDLKEPYYLTTPEEKDELLSKAGVDSILTLHFDHTLSKISADSFIRILHNQLKFSCLLIGHDFRFGSNRGGDIHTLSKLGEELGYCVHAIEPIGVTSQPVSSSIIRNLIKEGKVAEAGDLLGRPYAIKGQIVHGDGRGKHIGIPTANLDIWQEKLLPDAGVYAALADIDGKCFLAVVNIGHRPTFYDKPYLQTIEAHLIDFDREIYGEEMQLRFMKRIRPEKKFDNAQELMVQINQDIQYAREVLAHESDKTNLPA